MIPLYIGSIVEFSGKHFAALGLAMKFRDSGLRVGHFKPYGLNPVRKGGRLVDQDAAFFCQSIGINDPLEDVCPLVLDEEAISRVLTNGIIDRSAEVLSAFDRVSRDKDVVIISGAYGICNGSISGMSEKRFVQEADARIILVARLEAAVETLDRLLAVKHCFGDSLKGVIFNRISENKIDYAEKLIRPFMESQGIHVYAIIRSDPSLGAVPIGDLVEELNAKILTGESKMDDLVERFMIGAMNVSNALKYFRKQRNKAVITGGDRADIQLAALETSTRCLILTGDMYPSAAVLARADEEGIPIIVVSADTAETVEKCESLMGHLSLRSQGKLDHVAEIFNMGVDFARLCTDCGIILKT